MRESWGFVMHQDLKFHLSYANLRIKGEGGRNSRIWNICIFFVVPLIKGKGKSYRTVKWLMENNIGNQLVREAASLLELDGRGRE